MRKGRNARAGAGEVVKYAAPGFSTLQGQPKVFKEKKEDVMNRTALAQVVAFAVVSALEAVETQEKPNPNNVIPFPTPPTPRAKVEKKEVNAPNLTGVECMHTAMLNLNTRLKRGVTAAELWEEVQRISLRGRSITRSTFNAYLSQKSGKLWICEGNTNGRGNPGIYRAIKKS